MVESWVGVATGIAFLGGMAVIVGSWVRSTIIDRRIVRMMVACGIDESIAKKAGSQLEIDMRAVRRRCRACPEPETCERFLSGAALPDNGFCPNAAKFSALIQPTACRIHYDPRHRPGRRLDG
jgi:hypothetical protein